MIRNVFEHFSHFEYKKNGSLFKNLHLLFTGNGVGRRKKQEETKSCSSRGYFKIQDPYARPPHTVHTETIQAWRDRLKDRPTEARGGFRDASGYGVCAGSSRRLLPAVEGPGDTDVRRSDITGAAAQTPLADARTTVAEEGDSLLFVV